MSEAKFAIQTVGLSKRFGTKEVLRKISLKVDAGEIYGFLGPNGAGKTTTISCLMGFIHPNGGEIRLLGKNAATNGVELKRRIGYVPADPQLYPNLTGHDHIKLYRRFLGANMGKSANALAERLGLALDTKAKVLSTGNQQKLAFVLAASANPDLLILDEPTRGLDPLVADQVYGELRRFRDNGGTVFVSSHNLAEVQKLCDRVGLIKEGKLIASQSLSELLGLAVHEVRVSFTQPIQSSVFRSPHTQILSHGDRSLILRVTGDINQLVSNLAHFHISDLEVTHANLDEVFARYYQDDANAIHGQEDVK